MKKIVLSFIILGFGVSAYAQDVLYEAKIKKEEVPAVIIAAVERDYPEFAMEEFAALPLEYVEKDVIVNTHVDSIDDYDTFEIKLTGKGKEFIATYDRDGKLLSTMEHMVNITPPEVVRSSVAKAYPGWVFSKDTYNLSHFTGDKARERYRIELTKGNEKMHVYTDVHGKILNHPRMHKAHKI